MWLIVITTVLVALFCFSLKKKAHNIPTLQQTFSAVVPLPPALTSLAFSFVDPHAFVKRRAYRTRRSRDLCKCWAEAKIFVDKVEFWNGAIVPLSGSGWELERRSKSHTFLKHNIGSVLQHNRGWFFLTTSTFEKCTFLPEDDKYGLVFVDKDKVLCWRQGDICTLKGEIIGTKRDSFFPIHDAKVIHRSHHLSTTLEWYAWSADFQLTNMQQITTGRNVVYAELLSPSILIAFGPRWVRCYFWTEAGVFHTDLRDPFGCTLTSYSVLLHRNHVIHYTEGALFVHAITATPPEVKLSLVNKIKISGDSAELTSIPGSWCILVHISKNLFVVEILEGRIVQKIWDCINKPCITSKNTIVLCDGNSVAEFVS